MRDERIVLISKDCTGATVTEKRTEIFAEEKSATRSEFYAGFQVGLAPKMIFDVDPLEFEEAATEKNEVAEVEYKGKRYQITRTFQKNETSMEVVVRC